MKIESGALAYMQVNEQPERPVLPQQVQDVSAIRLAEDVVSLSSQEGVVPSGHGGGKLPPPPIG